MLETAEPKVLDLIYNTVTNPFLAIILLHTLRSTFVLLIITITVDNAT